MPFYLFKGRYTAAALKAMVDEPQDREAAASAVVEAVGGKMHCLYFCFGSDDVITIYEAPDDTAMAAGALAIGAGGAFAGGSTTKLMTSAEAVEAMKAAQAAQAKYKPATD